ncbi:MAG TPA: ABC transporter permease [Acidimicrobiales bacterium]|nr:ABC transporter permease [Acidimicrobiales bacterium]
MILKTGTSASDLFSYLTTRSNWHGSSGILDRTLQHLSYSVETLLIACAIALPLGFLSGHTGRGGAFLSTVSNATRALPTLGLLTIFAILIGVGLEAALIPLVVLAVPSILVNTYVGVRDVDRSVVDAARGTGMHGWQVLFRVEVPVALPLIFLGLRVAAIQVVSTATIAAYVGLGGLGRYIIDGQASRNFAELGAGALLVCLFAIVIEAFFLICQRILVSPGVRARTRTA